MVQQPGQGGDQVVGAAGFEKACFETVTSFPAAPGEKSTLNWKNTWVRGTSACPVRGAV